MKKRILELTAVTIAALALVPLFARPITVQAAAQDQKPSYTIPEYNAFQAANAEKDPAAKIKLLDDFVAKYPSSTLLQYVYQLYYQAYLQTKNYPKAIEYADKLVAMGDKIDTATTIQALQARVSSFSAMQFNPQAPDANAQLTKERDAALRGAKLLEAFPKPATVKMSDDDFAKQMKPIIASFYAEAGNADSLLKDYPDAVTALKSALVDKPDDGVLAYRLGLAYINMSPPQALDGFWALARAVDLKVSNTDKVKDYLRSQILSYEQLGCDNLVDAQLNELLQLAANSPDRPSSYTIPSADELSKISQSSNILTVISDLQAGGDKTKMTWLALCGAEFPQVVGKIIDEQKSEAVIHFQAYFGATPEDIQAATTANMDVKVWTATPPAGSAPAAGGETQSAPIPPQPDVVRLSKDDAIQFSGKLVSFDPSPFMLHWDQVKVDPTVIPEAAGKGKGVPKKKG
jgi:tetratricopeptide (TPR) repeat protein